MCLAQGLATAASPKAWHDEMSVAFLVGFICVDVSEVEISECCKIWRVAVESNDVHPDVMRSMSKSGA